MFVECRSRPTYDERHSWEPTAPLLQFDSNSSLHACAWVHHTCMDVLLSLLTLSSLLFSLFIPLSSLLFSLFLPLSSLLLSLYIPLYSLLFSFCFPLSSLLLSLFLRHVSLLSCVIAYFLASFDCPNAPSNGLRNIRRCQFRRMYCKSAYFCHSCVYEQAKW